MDPMEGARGMAESIWYIRLFDHLKVEQGEQTVTHFRTQKTAELLAYLAYHLHGSHTREKLIDVLWPDIDPDVGRSRFKQTLALLRRVLEPDGVPAGRVLATSSGNVQFRPDVACTDVGQFAAAIRSAETADNLPDKIASLTRAVDLYTGDLLPGCYNDWVE